MPNQHAAFQSAIEQRLSSKSEDSGWLGLVLLDVRDFSEFNRLYGFDCGDTLLEHVKVQLQEFCKDPSCYFYLGDDEFALLLPNMKFPSLAGLAASRIAENINPEFNWKNQKLVLDFNIGVSVSAEGATAETLILAGEQALAHAVSNNLPFYLQEAEHISTSRIDLPLHREFEKALYENEFELYYQPQLVIDNPNKVQAEALIRWSHPTRGNIPPDTFLPICAHTGNNLKLSQWVINTALRAMSEWSEEETSHISINLSADIIDSPELPQIISNSLKIWNVDPQRLTLEITENAVIANKNKGFANLQQLRDAGARISIDDFGTGQSSLEYFKLIPADELKIDRSFITNLLTSESDQKIVKLIIDLAHSFGMEVVAEGIESEQVLDLLKQYGCDVIQGYFFSKPLPAPEFKQHQR